MARFLILSCDGGGIRGYLSSLLLKQLDSALGFFGAKNGNIDLYAGTSTGGLIALALAQGKTIDSIFNLYATQGGQIFKSLDWLVHCMGLQAKERMLAGAPGQGLGGFWDVKEAWQVLYDDIGDPSLLTVLQSFIPGNPLLSSLPNQVMVATFQLSDSITSPASWGPLVIDNLPGSNGGATHLYEAALSTSAAPVYFPPYQHPKFGWCSDGGLFANNPAALAIGRAIQEGQSLSDIVLLSVGTGLTASSLPVSEPERRCVGLNHWAWFETSGPTPPFPLLNGMMDGVSTANDYLCGQLLGEFPAVPNGRYFRVNPQLPHAVPLDDHSDKALKMLHKVADDYIASPAWQNLMQWITNQFHK